MLWLNHELVQETTKDGGFGCGKRLQNNTLVLDLVHGENCHLVQI